MEQRADTFRERLRRLRYKAGLSQGALAKRAGISTAMVISCETGRKNPSMDTKAALARGLGVSLWMLAPELAESCGIRIVPLSGQLPPGNDERGSVLVAQEVLGMQHSSPALYALHVVDESLASENIHTDDYIIIDPEASLSNGLYLLKEAEVARILDGGPYYVVIYPDGRSERHSKSEPFPVIGRIICHGNWTKD